MERKERAAAALRAEPFFQDLVAQNPNAAVHMSGAFFFVRVRGRAECKSSGSAVQMSPEIKTQTVITPEDGLVEATNDLHDALFWPIQEMYEDSILHKTISPLLAARYVRRPDM